MPSSTSDAERKPEGYRQQTISTTSIALTSVPSAATYAIISVATQGVRWRDDAGVPTASVGMPVAAGGQIVLRSRVSIENFRVIRSGAADAELNISYYSAHSAY